WGGTTRLPRTIGLTRALPILLGGMTMPPRKALKAGLIDEVVRPEALLAAARRLVQTKPQKKAPALLDRTIAKYAKLRDKVLAKAEAQTRKLTYDNYPAPMKLIEVLRAGYSHGEAVGFEAERRALVDLSETDATKN